MRTFVFLFVLGLFTSCDQQTACNRPYIISEHPYEEAPDLALEE